MSRMTLESADLRVSIADNGAMSVTHKTADVVWDQDPFEGSPGAVTLRELATDSDVTMDLGKAGELDVQVTADGHGARLLYQGLVDDKGAAVLGASVEVSIALAPEAAEIELRIQDVCYDATRFSFGTLVYPQRALPLYTHVDDGHLVLPYNQGTIVPSGRFKVPLRDDWYEWDDLSWQQSGLAWGTQGAVADLGIYGWNGLSMPWFGAFKSGGAFIGIIGTDTDAMVRSVLNYDLQDDFSRRAIKSPYPRIAVSSPVWLSVKGAFAHPRRVTYTFVPHGTHVELAKVYRQRAQEDGLLLKLTEKAALNPNVPRLYGAALINIDGGYPWYTDYASFMYTWNDLKQVVSDLHDNLGLNKAVICVWGGYSKLPPESLPFHPDWGTEEDLRSAVELAQEYGYIYCAYHGYASLLFHSTSFDPEESYVTADGAIGQRWGGRCSATHLKYAKANLPEIVATTGQNADYTDIISCSGGRECFHPDHALTRAEDRANRIATFEYSREMGLVNGSELAMGYAMPHMDFAKGGMYHGKNYFLLQHIHAPLLSLVFHDCQVMFDGTVGTSRHGEYSNEALEGLAYGIQPIFSFNMPHYAGARQVIKETAAAMSAFQNATATQELVSHRYLGGGYDVQETVFAEGARVTINTDTAAFVTDDGLEVPARGYVVQEPDGSRWSGAVATTWATGA